MWIAFLVMKVLYLANLKETKFKIDEFEQFKTRIEWNELVGIKCSFNGNKNDIEGYKELMSKYAANGEETPDPAYTYEVYDSKSYIYDVLMLITFILCLVVFRSMNKTISNLILPSHRDLSEPEFRALHKAEKEKRASRKED